MNKDLRSMLKNISSSQQYSQSNAASNQRISVQTTNHYQPVEINTVLKGIYGRDNDMYSSWEINLKNTSIFTIKDLKIEVDTPVMNHYHIDLNSDPNDQKSLLSLPEWKKMTGGLKANESYQFGVTVYDKNPVFKYISYENYI